MKSHIEVTVIQGVGTYSDLLPGSKASIQASHFSSFQTEEGLKLTQDYGFIIISENYEQFEKLKRATAERSSERLRIAATLASRMLSAEVFRSMSITELLKGAVAATDELLKQAKKA